MVKKELLEEAIGKMSFEIDTDRNGMQYMIGEYVFIQYSRDYNAVRIEEPEGDYWICNTKDLNNLPKHLEYNGIYIN